MQQAYEQNSMDISTHGECGLTMSRAHHCGLTSLFVLTMNPMIVLSMLMFDGISGRPVSAGNTPSGRRCGMGWFISLHHDCDFFFGQAVTAKLEGGADIVLDVHGRAPGFKKKLCLLY